MCIHDFQKIKKISNYLDSFQPNEKYKFSDYWRIIKEIEEILNFLNNKDRDGKN